MKKNVLLILISFLVLFYGHTKSPEKVDKVVISQSFSDPMYDEMFEYEIYNGDGKDIKEFVNKVSSASSIWGGSVIKECVQEGEFLVEFYSKDKLILKYNIFNSENAFDEIYKKFKKLKVLDIIPNKMNPVVNDSSSFREDFLTGFTVHEINKNFGNFISQGKSFIYSEDSMPKTEMDPDYSRYLSKEDYGKEICSFTWIKGNITIVVWFITDENMIWKSFSSIEFGKDIVF